MKIWIIIGMLTTFAIAHEIISSYYGEECDNKMCEYTNKITLNVHGFMYGPKVIGYDNLTNSDITFDLNSIYITYGQNIDKMRACIPYYTYSYDCLNEIFNLEYTTGCQNTIADGCPDDTFTSIIPYMNGDCLGKQYRYVETVHFANCTDVLCTRSLNSEVHLSGAIHYNNLTRPFDVKLEYGVLNKISDDIKLNLVQIGHEYRYPTESLCSRSLDSKYVVMNLSRHEIGHYMSRRVLANHLVSNFIRDDEEYNFVDLLVSEKGFMKNEYGTYLFMYYYNNNTCFPVEYQDSFVKSQGLLKTLNNKMIFTDLNCTKRARVETIYECQMYNGEGTLDSEGNILCLYDGKLMPVGGKSLSSTIVEDVIIQLSFGGNYAVKQVFYDRCRIKEIEYVNNTIFIYDCIDHIHIKNMYTGTVYRVSHNMTIYLPNGVYSVVDYLNAPSFLVSDHDSTTSMYYAEDKFYVVTMLRLGFGVQTIESAKSYLGFYLIMITTVLAICILIIFIAIKIKYKVTKYKNMSTQGSISTNKSKRQKWSM